MPRYTVLSILLNLGLTTLFVLANNWALENQLEETFLTLAIVFGLTTVVSNAVLADNIQKRSR